MQVTPARGGCFLPRCRAWYFAGADQLLRRHFPAIFMTMTFEEVKAHLKQRFPFIMVDRVLELEPGKRIKTLKNVAGNEIQFLGHFPEFAIMPGTSIIEAIGQSASILFSHTTGVGINPNEFMALAAVNEMRFLVPVVLVRR